MKDLKCQYILDNDKRYVLDSVSGEAVESLVDCSSSGRENPHRDNKLQNLYLRDVYLNLHKVTKESNEFQSFVAYPSDYSKKAEKLKYCTSYLEFVHLKDKTKHISYLESCHCSLCTCCNFFRSRSEVGQCLDIFSSLFSKQEYCDCEFLHLTLTVPSVYGEDLQSTLDKMHEAWRRLTLFKEFKKVVLGWSRSLELTRNVEPDSKSYGLWHPHFHIVLVVRKNYFRSPFYLDQLHWLYLWNRAYQVHSFRKFEKFQEWYEGFFVIGFLDRRSAPSQLCTQLRIQAVKVQRCKFDSSEAKAKRLLSFLVEVLKYPFKPSNILTGDITIDSESVFFLDSALYHRRKWQVGGILKDIKSELRLSDLDDDSDLIQVAGVDPEDVDFFSAWWWRTWSADYLRGRLRSNAEKNHPRSVLGLPLLDT